MVAEGRGIAAPEPGARPRPAGRHGPGGQHQRRRGGDQRTAPLQGSDGSEPAQPTSATFRSIAVDPKERTLTVEYPDGAAIDQAAATIMTRNTIIDLVRGPGRGDADPGLPDARGLEQRRSRSARSTRSRKSSPGGWTPSDCLSRRSWSRATTGSGSSSRA
ncbi:MAG: hypothetical protein MZU91_06470 [Desulfosudis oleivorans]|nr:hypothetical protein [Desulfosudis oleivorans]